MFYCNNCASKNNWPKTLFKSRGKCEICEQTGQVCNEMPSKDLPEPIVRNADGTVSKKKQD